MAGVAVVGYLISDTMIRLPRLTALPDTVDGDVVWKAGGSGANVASWLAHLGVRTQFVGMAGDDATGRFLGAALRRRGVLLRVARAGRTPAVACLVTSTGDRHFVVDAGGPFAGEAIPRPRQRPDWLHLPAFTFFRADLYGQARDLVRDLPSGVRLSVDVSTRAGVQEFGLSRFRDILTEIRPQLLLMNASEADLLASGDELAGLAETVVVHRGRASSLVFASGVDYETDEGIDHDLAVIDSTGAGDAFAAGFLAGLVRDLPPLGATVLGHEVAQQVLKQLGAQPPGFDP